MHTIRFYCLHDKLKKPIEVLTRLPLLLAYTKAMFLLLDTYGHKGFNCDVGDDDSIYDMVLKYNDTEVVGIIIDETDTDINTNFSLNPT